MTATDAATVSNPSLLVFPEMASNEIQVLGEKMDGIERLTRRGKLSAPGELARKVTASSNSQQAKNTLLGQVTVAKGKRRSAWLKSLAKELDTIQFCSRSWISENVSPLPPLTVKEVNYEAAMGPCRDVRLPDNPSLKVVITDMGRAAADQVEDEGVYSGLNLLGTDDLDTESVPEAVEARLLGSPTKSTEGSTSAKPVSPVKPNQRAARSDQPQRRKSNNPPSRETSRDSKVPAKKPRFQSPVNSSRERAFCPFQRCGAELSKAHMLSQHLPGVFHPAISGEDITCRRIGALKMVARWLLGQRGTLDGLMGYLDKTGHVQRPEQPDSQLCIAMEDLCQALQLEVPTDLNVYASRNPVTALLHWKVLATLVSLLEVHQVDTLRSMFSLEEEEKATLPSLPRAFDSHCHLDRTIRDLKLRTGTLEGVVNALEAPESFQIHLSRAVGVFCDPKTYPSSEGIECWAKQGVVPVIGLHPRQTITEEEFGRLQALLEHPKVAGLGEVGLDHTEPVRTWADQMLRLQRVLALLTKPEQILVIHARSDSPVADEALLTVLYQLQAHPCVSRDQLIHVHCFTGTATVLKIWLQAFPNSYVGLTSVAGKFRDSEQAEAVKLIDRNRLLLETDAPYFNPPGYRKSTPGLLGYTALEVGKVLDMPWVELLELTYRNAERLYVHKQPPIV